MSNKPSDFEEWLAQHVSDADIKHLKETVQQIDIEVKAAVPKQPKKYKKVVGKDDYEDLFAGVLEPRKPKVVRPHDESMAADNTDRDDVADNRYEAVSEMELANDLLQKSAILGWENWAQQIVAEHNYSLLVGFADVVNKALVLKGARKKDLVQTRRRRERTVTEENTKTPSRPNWARKPLHHDFGYLYDRLVAEGFMEDSGKDIFMYYFAGEGEQPYGQLVWNADPVILSVLIDVLAKNQSQKPWALLSLAFVGLKPRTMSALLSRAKKNKELYGGQSYDQHHKTILRLLQ